MARLKSKQFDKKEIFRNLRTNIEFMQYDKKIQVISLTSTTKSEGKSTVSSNLAEMFAIKYDKVLLVDCDLRNPSIQKHFGISNSKGLVNLVASLSSVEEIESSSFVQHIKLDEFHQLSILTTGSRTPNPTEFLASKRFEEFLERAKKEYDYIIIDCSPVGIVSDAVPVSALSDGTLFVISSEENQKKSIKACAESLKRNGANILGIVLNKVDFKTK
ncbi:MAG: CpsD/CapB family tyrosine-protein kinase, partial [Bacillota bacterium]|nr:CpsD/CapB family tyrosine-protein kinase [Bacillota bacterium]